MAYSIDYRYVIQDRMSPAFERMSRAARKLDIAVGKDSRSMAALSQRMSSIGSRLGSVQAGLAGIGAGFLLKGALEESMQFQRSLNLTRAVTGATVETMEEMRAKALEWGSQTQFSSNQVAAAMAELGKMGNTTDQILQLMPGTMALAAAGEISMAEAANYSMGILNQFSLSLDKTGMVADVLARGGSIAATSVTGLAAAMSNTGLSASMAGLSIQDTTAALAVMASKNLEGAEAGTMMMNALVTLQSLPEKVAKGFTDLGIDINQFRDVTTGQMTDFWGLIEAMQEAGVTGAQLGTMFEKRSMKAMQTLVETSTEQIDSYRASLADTAGASKQMSDTLLEGIGPFVEFQSIMQNMKVIMGSFLADALTPLMRGLNRFLGGVQKYAPWLIKLGTVFLMMLTALSAFLIPIGLIISSGGQLVGVIGSVITVWRKYAIATRMASAAQAVFNAIMAVNPIVWIVLGVIALIAAIYLLIRYWDQVSAALSRVWDWLMKILDNPLIVAAGIIFASVYTIPLLIIKHWSVLSAFFADLWSGIVFGFTAAFDAIKLVLFTVADYFLTVWGSVARGILESIKTVSNALGRETPMIDEALGKIEAVQSTVRAQSAFGGGLRPREAPIPGAGGGTVRAEASVSVYTEQGMTVKPFEARGNLGYNLQRGHVR